MSDPTAAPPRRRLGLLAPPPPPLDRLALAKERLAALDLLATRTFFALAEDERVLKTTVSVCPDCLVHVPAVVHVRRGRVFLRKRCDVHGQKDSVIENDERFYRLSNKDSSGRRFGEARVFDIPTFESPVGDACCAPGERCGDSTDQMSNKTCTILVEVTDACNLACPVCYSDARGDRKLPLDDFKRYLTRLVERKGGLDSVQLTGGEALLHPEIWEMIAFLHGEKRIGKIYLPTNGLLLSREEVARRLVPFKDRVMVLLQYDGSTERTDRLLRDATPRKAREQALAWLDSLGIPVQLTMTLVRGVNAQEIGDVVRAGLRYGSVKVIALQPATYSGRFDLEQDAAERLTLSDVAKAVALQAGLRMRPEDFVPIPCSHPNCGWITLFVRRFGLVQNIVRHVDLPRVVERVAYRTLLSTTELRGAVGTARGSLVRRAFGAVARRVVRSTDVFTIAIKPFMDRHTYDQDRIAGCCHHLMDTRGNPVSFCEYNALRRKDDPWDRLPPLKA
jgi:7,8-dihydro-6-hydroxymethylpterin dimethyltransferase